MCVINFSESKITYLTKYIIYDIIISKYSFGVWGGHRKMWSIFKKYEGTFGQILEWVGPLPEIYHLPVPTF